MEKVLDIFFNNHNYIPFSEIKYDFSISFSKNKQKSFRFSYNDRLEQNGIEKKILTVFRMFSNKLDIVEKVKNLIQIRNQGNYQYQITFALDFISKNLPYRLKVYFEEGDSHHFIPEEVLQEVYSQFGFGEVDYLRKKNRLRAISVDFLFDKESYTTNVKDYRVIPFNVVRDSYDRYPLKLYQESKSFFYETYRMDSLGKKLTQKIYLVYNLPFYTNFKDILLYLKTKYDINILVNIIREAHRQNFQIYPLIFASDYTDNTIIKEDLYISFSQKGKD